MEAGQRVARELGYEVKDDEAKKFVARMQARGQDKTKLSDKELDNVAGGICGSYCGHACGNCFDLDW